MVEAAKPVGTESVETPQKKRARKDDGSCGATASKTALQSEIVKPGAEPIASGEKRAKEVEKLTVDAYRSRLVGQGKYMDTKPGSKSLDAGLHDPPVMPPSPVQIMPCLAVVPRRGEDTCFVFDDFPGFLPNLSPKEVLQLGSFGGGYFRSISSAVTGLHYKGAEVISEFPKDWFEGLVVEDLVTAPTYRKMVNKYKVSCGGSLGMWETSGWISELDPYGWFQWYCRFFLGRRTSDDARQVDRWAKGQGPKGRWRVQLMNKCLENRTTFDDAKVSPVMRQVLLHWAYELTSSDFETHRENQMKRYAPVK